MVKACGAISQLPLDKLALRIPGEYALVDVLVDPILDTHTPRIAGVARHEPAVVAQRILPGVEELGHKSVNGITDGGEVDGVPGSVGVVAEVDEVQVGIKGGAEA